MRQPDIGGQSRRRRRTGGAHNIGQDALATLHLGAKQAQVVSTFFPVAFAQLHLAQHHGHGGKGRSQLVCSPRRQEAKGKDPLLPQGALTEGMNLTFPLA